MAADECVAALGSETGRFHSAAGGVSLAWSASKAHQSGGAGDRRVASASSLDQIGPITKEATSGRSVATRRHSRPRSNHFPRQPIFRCPIISRC